LTLNSLPETKFGAVLSCNDEYFDVEFLPYDDVVSDFVDKQARGAAALLPGSGNAGVDG
jgi:hypothetical protein